LIVALLAGAALSAQGAPAAEVAPPPATIYVFMTSNRFIERRASEIDFDATNIGKLRNGGCLTAQVPPGDHQLSQGWEHTSWWAGVALPGVSRIPVQWQPGHVYYYRVLLSDSIRANVYEFRWRLEPVDVQTGELWRGKCPGALTPIAAVPVANSDDSERVATIPLLRVTDISAPPPGKGQVVFFRGEFFEGMDNMLFSPVPVIRENGRAYGKLGDASYFVKPLDPGVHRFDFTGDFEDSLAIDVKAGETYYVEAKRVRNDALGYRTVITPSTESDFSDSYDTGQVADIRRHLRRRSK
jgi:hypothetical protein